jgi:hypothetical protein
MQRIILSLILLFAFSHADQIKLRNGKIIEGRIISFSTEEGVLFLSEQGELKIPIAAIASFDIDQKTVAEHETIQYERLSHLGIIIDTTTVSGMKVYTPKEGPELFFAADEDAITSVRIITEPLNLSNDEYAKLVLQIQKSSIPNIKHTPVKKESLAGQDALVFDATFQKDKGWVKTRRYIFRQGEHNISLLLIGFAISAEKQWEVFKPFMEKLTINEISKQDATKH